MLNKTAQHIPVKKFPSSLFMALAPLINNHSQGVPIICITIIIPSNTKRCRNGEMEIKLFGFYGRIFEVCSFMVLILWKFLKYSTLLPCLIPKHETIMATCVSDSFIH